MRYHTTAVHLHSPLGMLGPFLAHVRRSHRHGKRWHVRALRKVLFWDRQFGWNYQIKSFPENVRVFASFTYSSASQSCMFSTQHSQALR